MANVISATEASINLRNPAHAVNYTLSDYSTITLTDIYSSGSLDEGFAPIGNNFGDLEYATGETYYDNIRGSYQGSAILLGIYDSHLDGVIALEDYLENSPSIANSVASDPEITIGSLTTNLFGASDVQYIDEIGLDYGLSSFSNYPYWYVIDDNTESPDPFSDGPSGDAGEVTLWAEAIIRGEGGDRPVSVSLAMPEGTTVTIATAYDVNFSSTLGGTEIDLDNDLATQIIDGSIWYVENTLNNTETFASNISQTYSKSIDPTFDAFLRPSSAIITTPPVFTLGTIDTDTFYNIGDGSTIIAGSAGYTLSVTSDGHLIYGLTESFPDFDMSSMGEVPAEVALPPGVYATPADGTLTGAMGASDLVIVNGDNQTYTGQYQGQVIIAAGGNDTLQAGANNETLIDLYSGSDTNILQANGYSGVTLISTPGITSDSSSQPGKQGSVFDFGAPQQYASNSDDIYPNVLIGGSGTNTFVMEPSLTSGTNIIYGGGGTSTYEVYGTVAIVYTQDANPTPQEIENLNLASGTDGEPLTYIVDPGPNDILEDPDGDSYSGTYRPFLAFAGGGLDPGYGVYQGTQNIGPTVTSIAFNASGQGPGPTLVGDITFVEEGPEDGTVGLSDYNNSVTLENFVNGDLGVDFLGSLDKGNPPLDDVVYPNDPGNVFNYFSKTYVGSGTSGSGNTTSSGGTSSGGGNYWQNSTLNSQISGVVTYYLSDGQVSVAPTITAGGILVIKAGGSELAGDVDEGGSEIVQSGGSAAGDVVSGGTEYVSSGGQVSYNALIGASQGSAPVPGQEIILAGGSVSSNTVDNGALQVVSSGGIDQGSIVDGGGEVISSGGMAVGDLLYAGTVSILSGGAASSLVINGGTAIIATGGIETGDVIGGGTEFVSGGSTTSAVVSSVGTAYVEAGGFAYSATIANGGTQIIAAGGIATGEVVSGGTEYVSSGGFVGSANVNGGSLVVSAGGQADILAVTSGLANIASGQTEILVQNNDIATVAAAGNAITTVTFNQSVSGGSLDFINNSTAAQTVFFGDQGSVTAFGGAGGGLYVGGAAGNNFLSGGSGAVTLIGGGNGDVLQANSNTGLNALYAGNGTETLTASAASGENQFDLGPNSNGVISTAGAGLQGFFLNSTGGTTTITGSQTQGAFNLYEFLGDATAGGGAYTLTDFSPANSAIFLLNGTASGPSDATVSTITGATGGTFIGLSDGTQITLLGVAAASVQVITASNGVSVIV